MIDVQYPASKYLRRGIPPQWTSFLETFQNHIRSIVSLKHVFQLAEQDPGDIYIFLRPDVRYLHDLPMDILFRANDPNFFASPQFGNELNRALNDRFAICGSVAAKL